VRSNRPACSVLTVAAIVCCWGAPTGSSSEPSHWIEARTGMVFVRVERGHFVMGSPPGEIGREAQETQHVVRLTHQFWLGAFEVTQRQWRIVMGSNPSHFQVDGDNRPVENVTWFEVQSFLERLTGQGAGSRFRLPTEAEWEYACRAGTHSPYSTGQALTHADANFAESPESVAAGRGGTAVVGAYGANPWGLHDMHGNVWEWTDSDYCPYSPAAVTNPVETCHSPFKVIRGGSWYFGEDSARCALRYTHRPRDRGFSLGFRVVRERRSGAR
jgi:formylglycine-generating enzyme required for sulfatase activity